MKEQFDALVASEVIEHVESVELFIKHCSRVVKVTAFRYYFVSILYNCKCGSEFIANRMGS